ncbi:MAG: adenylyl-sulfate kinase [Myxococcales bacterium]|nr:adenylyl-sulfate kinase [Myxococcales bacterium]
MTRKTSSNVTRHRGLVDAAARAKLLGQRGAVVWLTGLPASGKSTIGYALERRLIDGGNAAYVLDGDNVRHGLNGDLGFSPQDRDENIRRIGEVAALFADSGMIAITSFISPYRAARARAREATGEQPFVEIHVATPLAVCEERDPKGLYARARAGEVPSFTGVSAPYESPESPELELDTAGKTVDQCVDEVVATLHREGVLPPA